MDRHHPPAVQLWLNVVLAMLLAMTMVGGVTRLTGSGLSMVEWRPLMGALPPIGEAAWQEVFAQYRATPQFRKVNHWMTLGDFQRIFFWEYLHRLLGRLIGVVVALPWLWFLVRRQLGRRLLLQTSLLFGLGALQGALGWYMVVSGLVDVPRVSHFRLAAHLLLAFAVAQYALWIRLDLTPLPVGTPPARRAHRLALMAFYALLLLQIVYGAFVAGLRAGWLAATFPDMNGLWLPGPFVGQEGVLHALLYEGGLIHWTHRALGWTVLVSGLGLGVLFRRTGKPLAAGGSVLIFLVSLQFLLGVITVVGQVPIPVAVAHQGVALVLLGCSTWLAHRSRGNPARGTMPSPTSSGTPQSGTTPP